MKSGMKKTLKPSSKHPLQQVRDFLLTDVGRKQDWPKLNEDELEVFSLLHKSGLPFAENVSLSFRAHEALEAKLRQGVPFSGLVQKQNSRRMKQLGSLLGCFSLDDAILYDGKLRQARSILFQKLFSKSLYPLFIMAFSSVLTWFFSLAILPSFGGDADGALLDLLKGFSILFWLLMLVLAIFLLAVFVFPSASSHWFAPLFRLPVVRTISSMEMAALFECTQSSTLSTQQSLDFISASVSFPFASLLAKSWKKKLKAGSSFFAALQKDPRLDPAFLRFFEIGLHGSLMPQMMAAYSKSAVMKLEKTMKKLSNWILCLAYGSVGILAISVYQVMLAPLTMLESF